MISIAGCFKESKGDNKQETKQIKNNPGQTDTGKSEDKLEVSQSGNNENVTGEVKLKDTRIKIKIKDQELIAVMDEFCDGEYSSEQDCKRKGMPVMECPNCNADFYY